MSQAHDVIAGYLFGVGRDVVGVYNGTEQVFSEARPVKASVRESAKPMEHPVESGAVITDHLVFQSVEIDLQLNLASRAYADVYKTIRRLYQSGALLTVQTRAESYDRMIIVAMPHEEDPELYDALTVTLKLKEVKIVEAQIVATYKARRPAQGKTADLGEKQAKDDGSFAYQKLKEPIEAAVKAAF